MKTCQVFSKLHEKNLYLSQNIPYAFPKVVAALPDGTYGKSWESPEVAFLKMFRFSFLQYGHHFAVKGKASAMVFIKSPVVHCAASI